MELAMMQDDRSLDAEKEKVMQQQKSRPVTARVRDALRRFAQRNIVGKLRQEATNVYNQDEYAMERAKYMGLLDHLKAQEASLKLLGQCVTRLGDAMLDVGECNARIRMDHSDTRFRDMMRQVQAITTAYAPAMEQHALPHLRHHVKQIESLLPQMHQRDNLEADYHTAVHKHERAKGKGKMHAIKETGQKLDAAQHALVVVTRDLLVKFGKVQAVKGSLTAETLQMTCTSLGQLLHEMTILSARVSSD